MSGKTLSLKSSDIRALTVQFVSGAENEEGYNTGVYYLGPSRLHEVDVGGWKVGRVEAEMFQRTPPHYYYACQRDIET